jgi:hypothetical protein
MTQDDQIRRRDPRSRGCPSAPDPCSVEAAAGRLTAGTNRSDLPYGSTSCSRVGTACAAKRRIQGHASGEFSAPFAQLATTTARGTYTRQRRRASPSTIAATARSTLVVTLPGQGRPLRSPANEGNLGSVVTRAVGSLFGDRCRVPFLGLHDSRTRPRRRAQSRARSLERRSVEVAVRSLPYGRPGASGASTMHAPRRLLVRQLTRFGKDRHDTSAAPSSATATSAWTFSRVGVTHRVAIDSPK